MKYLKWLSLVAVLLAIALLFAGTQEGQETEIPQQRTNRF